MGGGVMSPHEKLRERIAEIEDSLADLNFTREEAALGYEEWDSVCLETEPGLFFQLAEHLQAEIGAHEMYQQLDQLRESLDLELATVSTRYLVTDGALISPAGFGIGEPVYIKNDIWVETDRVPEYCNLNVYDMHASYLKYREAAA
jgi:hypothetical protein